VLFWLVAILLLDCDSGGDWVELLLGGGDVLLDNIDLGDGDGLVDWIWLGGDDDLGGGDGLVDWIWLGGGDDFGGGDGLVDWNDFGGGDGLGRIDWVWHFTGGGDGDVLLLGGSDGPGDWVWHFHGGGGGDGVWLAGKELGHKDLVGDGASLPCGGGLPFGDSLYWTVWGLGVGWEWIGYDGGSEESESGEDGELHFDCGKNCKARVSKRL